MSASAYASTMEQRFETKYLISEIKAHAISDFIQPFVRADVHGREYVVGTTYLDSPDLRLYHESVCGVNRRFKLRVRSYRTQGNGHVYLEIKRRLDQMIRKERVSVETLRADEYLSEPFGPAEGAVPQEDREFVALHNFRMLREALDARPCVDITYLREAYVSAFGDPVRITFDRNIECLPACSYAQVVQQSALPRVQVVSTGVVLEIKYTDRCPHWLGEVIQRFELVRRSVSKYVFSVDALKHAGVHLKKETKGDLS